LTFRRPLSPQRESQTDVSSRAILLYTEIAREDARRLNASSLAARRARFFLSLVVYHDRDGKDSSMTKSLRSGPPKESRRIKTTTDSTALSPVGSAPNSATHPRTNTSNALPFSQLKATESGCAPHTAQKIDRSRSAVCRTARTRDLVSAHPRNTNAAASSSIIEAFGYLDIPELVERLAR
jgi:hypothetical protein